MTDNTTEIRAFGRLVAREIDHTELEQVSGGTCDDAWLTSTSTWTEYGDDKDDDCSDGGGGGGGGGGGSTDTDDSDPTALIVVLT